MKNQNNNYFCNATNSKRSEREDNCCISAITTDINGNIYAYEFEKEISVFDSNGVLTHKIDPKKDTILYSNSGLKGAVQLVLSMAIDPPLQFRSYFSAVGGQAS